MFGKLVTFYPEDSSVPLEIQLRGPAMQQLYSQACRQGARPVHSTRGLVVGQFRSGKTCVVRRLTGEKAVEDEPITDGIEISPSVMTTTWRKAKGLKFDCCLSPSTRHAIIYTLRHVLENHVLQKIHGVLTCYPSLKLLKMKLLSSAITICNTWRSGLQRSQMNSRKPWQNA